MIDHLRGNGATAIGGLPLRGEDIVAGKGSSKVLAELRNTQDDAACLVVEAGEDEDVDGVDTPDEGERVLADGLDRALLVVFGGGGGSDLLEVLGLADVDDAGL